MATNPPKTTRRPGRPRSEESRQAILGAAYELLRREGLRNISIDSIAREAGVSKATIYRWWPSKEAVLMEGYLAAVQTRIAVPRTASPLADLRAQLYKVIDFVSGADGDILRQIIACSQFCPEIQDAFRQKVQEPRRADARKMLGRAVEAGEIRADVKVDTVLDLLFGPIFHRLLSGIKEIDHELVDSIFDCVMRGLKPS